MSLPHATQDQINKMNAAAEKQFGPQESVELPTTLHPMLQNHAEPVEMSFPENQGIDSSEPVVDMVIEEKTLDIDDQPRIETNKEYNMRMLREGKERAERERDELMRQFAMMQQPKVAIKEEEPDYLAEMGLDEDSLVEGKHFKAYLKKQKELEKQLKE